MGGPLYGPPGKGREGSTRGSFSEQKLKPVPLNSQNFQSLVEKSTLASLSA